MSDIIQWAIVAAAVIVSALVLTRKFRKQAKGKCDGCCEGCKLHANVDSCDDPRRIK